MSQARIPFFTHHPGTFLYSFGSSHPLKPVRLQLFHSLLERLATVDWVPPQAATEADLFLVHSPDYVEAVRSLSQDQKSPAAQELAVRYQFYGDNPPFPGMWEPSLAYVGGATAAARAVANGAPLAFGMDGGLHHAMPSKAAGFCIFNDPAIACAILRERFDRVAYIDIDVHHGDGVQEIFLDDPNVLTISIHESGRTIWPGTGWPHESGAHFTSVNLPIPARSSGYLWREAFRSVALPALEAFQPQAIVLQMGCDAHYADRLGHLYVDSTTWWEVVADVRDTGIPIVAMGGGGYTVTNVPRLWAGAVLTLAGAPIPDRLPEPFASDWGTPTFADLNPPEGKRESTEWDEAYDQLRRNILPNIPRP